jgi:hypothetical protein
MSSHGLDFLFERGYPEDFLEEKKSITFNREEIDDVILALKSERDCFDEPIEICLITAKLIKELKNE